MTFAWPHAFWLLLVPVALLVAELAQRRRAAAIVHPKIFQAEAGAQQLTFVTAPARRRRARWWLGVGLVLCVGALARPQWGRIDEPVFDQAREIIIAIDLSRSMLSPDVRPSRLERAKLLTQSLLEKLSGERVGLISFAGTAFLQSPLSSDYEILREFLPALGPDFLPEGGTNYRALIDTALAAFSTSPADRFLIVLSDGEATDDDWRSEAAELKKKGIRVISLGIGTTAGAMIPDGAGAFVKDERGAVVLSKLESGTLQELANITGGTYRDASSWIDLAGVLSSTVEAGRKGKFMEKNTVRLVERFQWPLAFGLWCLLVSFCYEFPVRPRPRALKIAPATTPVPSAIPPVLAAGISALLLFTFGVATARAADVAVPLGKIVSRLSVKDDRTARDWAELAQETVSWGRRLQDDQRAVPEGPVHDALSAVDLGSGMNAKTADWPKLRQELEELLRKPEQKKNQQQQNQPQPQNQQQDQDQQSQDQKNQDSSGQPKSSEQKDQGQDSSAPQNQNNNRDGQPPPQSAFGNMQERDKSPPPAQENQKVGGVPEKKNGEPMPADPELTLPLQKLDQLRNQDSPAELFQLMDPNSKKDSANKKKGKDW